MSTIVFLVYNGWGWKRPLNGCIHPSDRLKCPVHYRYHNRRSFWQPFYLTERKFALLFLFSVVVVVEVLVVEGAERGCLAKVRVDLFLLPCSWSSVTMIVRWQGSTSPVNFRLQVVSISSSEEAHFAQFTCHFSFSWLPFKKPNGHNLVPHVQQRLGSQRCDHREGWSCLCNSR